MTTLAARVEQRDRAAFVGRRDELALFDGVLAGERPVSVIHVVGMGGIGKSALLRDAARRAADRGLDVHWIEGRELPPFPDAVEPMLAGVGERGRAMLIFDSYELIGSLDSHLRDIVIPTLPDDTLIVFGGRMRPSRGWYEGGWDAVVATIELGGLADGDAERLARAHGATDAAARRELVRTSHGSPLALVVGATTGATGSVADLAERLLGDEVDRDRHRTLAVAAIARITTPELLGAVLPDADPQESYKWLVDRSFVEPLAEGVTLHPLVAQAVRESLRQRDPRGEGELRRRIADHVHARAIAGRFGLSADLQHLVVDQTVRWGYSFDIGSRYRVDVVRPRDADQIGKIMNAVGAGEWWATTRVYFDEHPQLAGVARDQNGKLCGYYVAVSPDNAPPLADGDPLLGPWLRYARSTLRSTAVVLWREAIDLTGEMGEVTALLGSGGAVGAGVANPRYGFLPIAPTLPAARAFSEALNATHVSELDFVGLGQHLECHVIDFGPGGVLGFQRDWVYRETGAVPPSGNGELWPGPLLRLLRQPNALLDGPAWLGDRPSDRRSTLRAMVVEALAVFGTSHDDRLARAIIEAAYLREGESHEAIARSLHLSRSAYFRRLQAASQLVEGELAGMTEATVPRSRG